MKIKDHKLQSMWLNFNKYKNKIIFKYIILFSDELQNQFCQTLLYILCHTFTQMQILTSNKSLHILTHFSLTHTHTHHGVLTNKQRNTHSHTHIHTHIHTHSHSPNSKRRKNSKRKKCTLSNIDIFLVCKFTARLPSKLSFINKISIWYATILFLNLY